jgi:alpha-N-arabinofuranosidase
MVVVGRFAVIQNNTDNPLDGANFNVPRNQWPYWIGSVAEAVFLLGTERNGGQIFGASYAPGFQNLNSYEWAPDLISFTADPNQTVLSTSYHTFKLLSNNRITHTLPVTMGSGDNIGPAYWVAGQNEKTGAYLLKTAIYNATSDVPFSVSFAGLSSSNGSSSGASATLTVLTAADESAHNAPGLPEAVSMNATTVTASSNGTFSFSLPNLSVAVLVVNGTGMNSSSSSSSSGASSSSASGSMSASASSASASGMGGVGVGSGSNSSATMASTTTSGAAVVATAAAPRVEGRGLGSVAGAFVLAAALL